MQALKRYYFGSGITMMLSMVLIITMTGCTSDIPLTDLKSKWGTPPSNFVMVDKMNVHFRDEGPRDDPNPIVLLHGTSSSLHTWEGWTQNLKHQRRIIRLDLPGFGLTGPFPDDNYTMDHYVEFLEEFLDIMEIQQYVLVGNSFGGALAWHTALKQPLRINKLILVDAVGYPDNSKSMPIGFRIAKIPLLNKIMEYTLPRKMVESSVRNVYADPNKVTVELVDRYYDLTLRAGNRHALIQRFKQIPNSSKDSKLIKLINQPTLILWGEKDNLIPVAYADQFHKDINESQLVKFENLGHVPQEEDPLKSVAPVKVFLNID
ncbi:alpha/beta fold hydrolase [Acinetobacter beijerinckii]|uniref:alpha/beta fold hydrolase n=1 Tax=Acinetobacter beijerinckii TaxID=262668 RepID=UPI00069876E3|nr:alpha/beta hydrolase [Acinetobacter beijerinckii]